MDDKEQKPPNYKTVLCKWWEQYGKCTYVGCTFAHGQKELNFNRNHYNQPKFPPTPNPKQNTTQKLQTNYYEDDGNYGDQEYDEEEYYGQEDYGYDNGYCSEQKKKHPKFKTEMCRNIDLYGECNYPNCTFAHDRNELRKLPAKYKN